VRRIARSVTASGCLGLALVGSAASAQSGSAAEPDRAPPLLDVPYLPQSELLCGGAAVAMVERWWGRRGVYGEDFAELVRPELRGIRTTDLAAAARARGWETRAFDGTPEEVRQILNEQVPVVALIEVAPDRFHYVVLLGWSDGQVTFHDPAIAPSRSVDEARFLAAWSGGERWAMVLRPAATPPPKLPIVDSPLLLPADSMPCRPWIDRALDAVAANRLEDASDLLGEAGRACPGEPLVLRELAGVRFKQRRLTETIHLSAQYVARVPDDDHAWKLLAASRFLDGDREGALRAWNVVGLPIVDLTRIDGVRAVRFRTIADAVNVSNGTMLTAADLALARRRVADLGAVRRAAVEYQPVDGGRAEVRVQVIERPVLGQASRLLVTNGLRAITQRAIGLTIASPTGGGELWTADWRWEHANPRLALGFEMPVRLGVSGAMNVKSVRERFRFASDTTPTGVFEESRSVGSVSFGGWMNPVVRPFAGLGWERWSGGRQYLDLTAGAEFRAAGDRLVVATTGQYARALADHPSWFRGDLRAQWSSAVGLSRRTWSARLGGDLTSGNAPLGVRPVASEYDPWVIPLRAHPRTVNGLLPGATSGQRMIHGGLSGDQPVYRVGLLTLAVGVFLDGARIMDPSDGSGRNRTHLDAGGGIRIGILDGELGVVRVDLATGLTARGSAITVGLHQSWPPFRSATRLP
jgi:hypothetical protein